MNPLYGLVLAGGESRRVFLHHFLGPILYVLSKRLSCQKITRYVPTLACSKRLDGQTLQ